MQGSCEIYMDNQIVGYAEFLREGLYYRVKCKCKLPKKELHTLIAVCGDRQLSLGTVIPVISGIGLETRIPAKRLDCNPFTLHVVPKQQQKGIFIPLKEGRPFSYLHKLDDAIFQFRDNDAGILVAE